MAGVASDRFCWSASVLVVAPCGNGRDLACAVVAEPAPEGDGGAAIARAGAGASGYPGLPSGVEYGGFLTRDGLVWRGPGPLRGGGDVMCLV